MVTHRINRVEFELEVTAVELGRHVSERVSLLHGQRIPSLLERICSEVDDSESFQRIDKLELELGSIALSNFDDELLARLEAALRVALRGRARPPAPPEDAPPPSASDDANPPRHAARSDHALELLDAHAWTGNLPWWADAREVGLVALHIRELLVHAPTRWLELLREHADDRVGLDRLARACDDELFELILERAGASLPDVRELEQLLALVGVRSERVRSPLLGALGRHGRLEPAIVLPTVLRAMDATVLAALAERIDAQPGLSTAAMRVAIANANARVRQGSDDPLERAAQSTRDPIEHSAEHDAVAADELRSEKSEQADDPLDLDDPSTVARSKSTPIGVPEHATTDADIHLDPPPRDAGHPPRPEHAAPRDARPPSPPPRIDRDDRQLQLARRRALARLDELYIEDAGLVILWPFIERLFTRVELLDAQRRFHDEAAQTQAIALLAHLALGDPAPLEHQLAFAKLLCGRAPEHACELDGPLDEALCEESERMLAAVIDHAPILDSMPIPRFRTTFLQRAGALGIRTGSWLLTVERQPYDLVLQRFSWSWAWVKFPWMPDPLTVEW